MNSKKCGFISPPSARILATAFLLAATLPDALGALTTYPFDGTTSGNYTWSSGTGFVTPPVSGEGAAIEYYRNKVAANGLVTIDSINDIDSFQLSSLVLGGTGAATSGTTTINLKGKSLHFISDGENPAVLDWSHSSPTGSRTISYTLSNNIGVTGTLSLQASTQTTTARTFQSSFFGDGTLSKGTPPIILRGFTGADTFFRGDVDVSAGSFQSNYTSSRLSPTFITLGTVNVGSTGRFETASNTLVGIGRAIGTGTIGGSNGRLAINTSRVERDVFEGRVAAGSMIYKGGTGELELKNGFEGGGGWTRVYAGKLVLPQLAGIASSGIEIAGGTLQMTGTGAERTISSVTYTNLLGSNSAITLYEGGNFMISPEGGSVEEHLSVTANVGRIHSRGGMITLDKGKWGSLTARSMQDLELLGDGASFLLKAAGGLAGLGVTEKLIFTTAPTTSGGVLSTAYVGIDNDVHESANFMTYDSTDGFKQLTAYDLTNSLDTSTGTSRVDINTALSMTATKDIHALRVTNTTLNLNNFALNFKGISSRTGLILNGGTLTSGTVNAANQLMVYTSRQHGKIESNITGNQILTKLGEGTLWISGSIGGTNTIQVVGGAVRLANVNGLNFNGSWSGNLLLKGGVLETSGTLTRDIGGGSQQINFNGTLPSSMAGFSAAGGDLAVRLGGSQKMLTWRDKLDLTPTTGGTFLRDGGILLLNSETATGHVDLQNHLNLGGSSIFFERIIDVRKGASGTSSAEISGNISSVGYANGVSKTGEGSLLLSGSNTFQGDLTIGKGTVKAGSAHGLSTAANRVRVNTGATLDLNGQTIANGKKIILNGSGENGLGALVNNSTTGALLGDGISLNVAESSGTWDLSEGLPTIAITGGDGSGASASIDGLIIRDITVLTSGSYSVNTRQNLTIANGLKGATAIVMNQNNSANGNGPTSVSVIDPGLFNVNPLITTDGTPVVAPTFQANLALNLEGISLNAGSGYTVAPTVTVSGGSGYATLLAEVGEVQLASDSSVGGSGDLWIKPAVTGSGKLTKIGAGTLTLSGNNKYSGGTQINAGRILAGSQTALGLGAVSVGNNATLQLQATTANDITLSGTNARLIVDGRASGNILFGADGGRLEGSGSVTNALAFNNINQTLAPGNSPGTLTLDAAQSWSAFTYEWEVNQWNGGVAGTNYDQVVGNNALTFTSDGNFVLKIHSLTSEGTAGALSSFSETSQQWVIIAANEINGFNADRWTLDLSGFTTPEEWAGVWSLQRDSTGLLVSYQAVPEPSTYLSILAGSALLYGLRRSRSKAKAGV